MKHNKLMLSVILGLGAITLMNSCKKDPIEEEKNPTTPVVGTGYSTGNLISNEGNFGSGDGSISYYNPTTDKVSNTIFSNTNSRPLGDVVQSVVRGSNSTYICVNASNKIEVVNSKTFNEEATISITKPRYMAINGTTGYASSWDNNGEVAVIDLTNNTVTSTITVGAGPENMLITNDKIYVANGGDYSFDDSTLTVIDANTNTVIKTINLKSFNPTAIVKGIGNTIWVLAKGKTLYSTTPASHEPSKLLKINTETGADSVLTTTTLFADKHPSSIGISTDKTALYFGGSYGFDGIYTTSTASPATPSSLITQDNYGFFVSATTGNIFVLEQKGGSNGNLLRYSAAGSLLGSYEIGVFPSGGTKSLRK